VLGSFPRGSTAGEIFKFNFPWGSHCVDDNAIVPIARDAVAAIKKYRLLKRENTEELKRIAISADDPTLKNEIVGALGLNGDTFCREQLSGQQDLGPL
jgi:hypothetical protein